jgi:hypothetical protein
MAQSQQQPTKQNLTNANSFLGNVGQRMATQNQQQQPQQQQQQQQPQQQQQQQQPQQQQQQQQPQQQQQQQPQQQQQQQPQANLPGMFASQFPGTSSDTGLRKHEQFGVFTALSKKYIPENDLTNLQQLNQITDRDEYTGKLERELGDQRVQTAHIRHDYNDLELRHQDQRTQYDILSCEYTNLRREYDALMQTKSELHATQAELERMQQEKNFHHEQHIMLRRDLLHQLNKDFENDQLKRDKVHVEDELRATRQKAFILEKQIEELLVFANKPKDEEEGGREFYFAKKIVVLEDTVKELAAERDTLSWDNKKFKDEIRSMKNNFDVDQMNDTNEEKSAWKKGDGLNDTRLDGGTDGLIEQLRKIKRKNDMLTKENSLIRKELDGALMGKKPVDHHDECFDAKKYEIEDLKTENSHLKGRIKHLEEMFKGKQAEARVRFRKLKYFLGIWEFARQKHPRWGKGRE